MPEASKDSSAGPRHWFDRGYAAFSTAFPTIAASVELHPFYVCPLCLRAFGEDALRVRFLTREDVPPRSVGGRRLALTCKPCNSKAGHDLDIHARGEANISDFATGKLREIKAELGTKSGRVPVRLTTDGRNIQMHGVPRATSPTTHAQVMGDFEAATGEGKWQDFTFDLSFPTFSHQRAATSWLRSAYLAFFATLGYRFVFRPELDIVRKRIAEPMSEEPRTFRIIRPEVSLPLLIRIQTPEVFRSFAFLYGHNVVFLPTYRDSELYARLSAQPDTSATLTGVDYPWPTGGPMFLHDRPLP